MLLAPVAAVATALVLIATVTLSVRRASAVAGLMLLLLAAIPASATEIRRSGDSPTGEVVIAAGETIDDTVVAVGKNVLVEGTITGDLVALAQHVRVVGEVRGSLATLARWVVVEGNVGGDVYSLSQSIELRGGAGRNLHAAAGDIDIDKGARIGRDALLASEGIRVGGSVGRDVRARGDVFRISGQVGRNVDITGHVLDLAGSARVDGDLSAKLQSFESFARAPGAHLAHEPRIEENPPRHERGFAHAAHRWTESRFYFWEAIKIAGTLALALLLFWLVPALFQWTSPPAQSLLRKGGIGFLALVATPVAAILVCLTVIGLPIGILSFGAYCAALLLSSMLVSLAVGQAIVRSPRAGIARVALPLLAGLVVVRAAVNLPYMGGIVQFLVVVIGLGLLLAQLAGIDRRLRRMSQPLGELSGTEGGFPGPSAPEA